MATRIEIVKSNASFSDAVKEFCPIPNEDFSPARPDYTKYNNCLIRASVQVDKNLTEGVLTLNVLKDKVIQFLIEGKFGSVGNKLLKLISEMSEDDKENLTLPFDGCRLHVLDSLAPKKQLKTLVRNVYYFIHNVIFTYKIIF